MGFKYSGVFAGTLANAGGDADLFGIYPADDRPVKLRGLKLGQTSELGDAADEQLRITITRLPATVTNGSGGSALSALGEEDSRQPAGACTVRINDTTPATSSGTAEVLEEFSWDVRIPLEMYWPDGCGPVWKVGQGEALTIKINGTVTDDITGQATLLFEEE